MNMNFNCKMAFVIGTGRSGTCWVGDILGMHPQIRSFVEPQPVFRWVTEVAHSPAREAELLPKIVAEYHRLAESSAPHHFADKTHPGIWIAEYLAASFPHSFFLGVTREVEPTVASMLRHPGVRRWCEQWDNYPCPNRFLGITENNLDWYRQASLLERCVARWFSHTRELLRLGDVLKQRFLLVSYEQLVRDPANCLSHWQRFLGLEQSFPEIQPSEGSLNKWKSQLSKEDLTSMAAALDFLESSVHRQPLQTDAL